ncbi:MAG: hypothetical protein ACKOPN_03465, partial [Prochlorococcaceae cyanobacterium]
MPSPFPALPVELLAFAGLRELLPGTALWALGLFLPISRTLAGPERPEGPALLLVHGFGASTDHWRHNIPVLAE